MNKYTYNVYDLISGITDRSVFDFKNDNVTVWDNQTFFFEMLNKYDDMYYSCYAESIDNARDIFVLTYQNWLEMIKYNILRFFEGLYTDYNILYNYDKYIIGGKTLEKHKGSLQTSSQTGSNNQTITSNGENNQTNNTTDTLSSENTNNVYGEDNTNSVPSDNSVTTGNNTSKNTINGSNSLNSTNTSTNSLNNSVTLKDISDTIFDKDVELYNSYREYGNIGVQTPADVMLKEYTLRFKNYCDTLIAEFFNMYCYYLNY